MAKRKTTRVEYLTAIPPHVMQRLMRADQELRAGLPLPNYSPVEWVNGIAVKLGEAARHAHFYEMEEFHTALEAVAAVALHAIENTTDTTFTTEKGGHE